MFRHQGTSWTWNSTEVLSLNVHDELRARYSILNTMESFKSPDGKFHFMLCYSEISGEDGKYCNEWKQTSNPTNSTTIEGYEEISIAFPNRWEGPNRGLALSSSSNCFIDNSPEDANYWFCIGCFVHNGYGKFPGPFNFVVNSINLYVNVDHLTN